MAGILHIFVENTCVMRKLRFLMAAVAVVLAVAGCRKHDRYQRQSGGTDNGSTIEEPAVQFELRQNEAWKIVYEGRKTVSGDKVDVISTNVPNNIIYLVSVLTLEDYSSYNGDNRKFMENELEWVMGMDKAEQSNYIYTGPQTLRFDPFRHGDWYAFIMALDSDYELTGEFNYLSFEVEEEEPSAEFERWLGTWKVSGRTPQAKEVTYLLSVTSEENNYMYRVAGWETLEKEEDGWMQMNQEDIVTFYDSGDMYFTSQYIQTYKDEEYNDTVEEVFLGEIYYKGVWDTPGVYIIEEEDRDVACAVLGEDGKTAAIEPVKVTAVIGDHDYETEFYDMKYFGWSQNERSWFVYNESVAVFPYAMEKLSDEPAPKTKSFVQFRGAKTRPQRGKIHISRSERSRVKAVFAGNR